MKNKILKSTAGALSKKSLGNSGKAAIGTAVNSVKSAKKISKAQIVPTQMFDNNYAMQMAKDISSYRYGKRMTGFVN